MAPAKILLALVVCACLALTAAYEATCVPGKDYFPDKVPIEYQHIKDYTVQYFNTYKIVTNMYSNVTFLLYICGSVPTIPTPPTAGFKVFQLPLQNVASEQTVTLTFFEILGVQNTLKFAPLQYTTSPCIRKLGQQGKISEFEGDGTYNNATKHAQQMALVDAAFGWVYRSVDPKYISQSASGDITALHRAGWSLYVSTFYNLEGVALRFMRQTEDRFACQQNWLNSLNLPLAQRPKLAWVSTAYPSGWEFFNASYKVDFMRASGARVVDPAWRKVYTDIRDVWAVLADVDVVIDESYMANTFEKFLSNFQLFPNSTYKFVQNRAVYQIDKRQNPTGSLDWFESALAQPDVVLQDLMSILYPAQFPAGIPRRYLRAVYSGFNDTIVVPSLDSCPDPNAPLTPYIIGCTINPFPIASSASVISFHVLALFMMAIVAIMF